MCYMIHLFQKNKEISFQYDPWALLEQAALYQTYTVHFTKAWEMNNDFIQMEVSAQSTMNPLLWEGDGTSQSLIASLSSLSSDDSLH